MGKRTYALYKEKVYSWIDLLRKFKIKHQKGASAHVEWNTEASTNKKLPFVEVVDKNGNCMFNVNEDSNRETFIPKSNNITKRHRQYIWNRDIGDSKSGKCYVCGQTITDDNFECGHIISIYNKGGNHVSNLRTVCLPCNRSMGITNLEDFKKDFSTSLYNDNIKYVSITKETVIQFLETHKPNDTNAMFFDKTIELLEKQANYDKKENKIS